MKKTIASRDKYLPHGTHIHFGDSDEEVRRLLESPEAHDVKEKALRFQQANRITASGLTNIIKGLNNFFNGRRDDPMEVVISDDSEEVKPITKV